MGENDIHGAIFIVGGVIGTILAFKFGPVLILFGVAFLLGLL